MSHDKRHRSLTQEELRVEVEHARADLGRTVEDLAAKADVKARAQDRAHAVRERAGRKRAELRDRAGQRARTAREHRRPLLAAAAVGSGTAVFLGVLLFRLRGHSRDCHGARAGRGGRRRR